MSKMIDPTELFQGDCFIDNDDKHICIMVTNFEYFDIKSKHHFAKKYINGKVELLKDISPVSYPEPTVSHLPKGTIFKTKGGCVVASLAKHNENGHLETILIRNLNRTLDMGSIYTCRPDTLVSEVEIIDRP